MSQRQIQADMIDDTQRSKILSKLARYTGRIVPWDFIKKTDRYVTGIDRFHNLITGIYKPAWSEYALSIIMKNKSPYDRKDEYVFLDDGRWLMTYAPRSGGLSISDNKALIKCMSDHLPVGVFIQLTDKTNRDHGATYRVLGLGSITNYDAKADVFYIEAVEHKVLENITNVLPDPVERYQTQLYAQLTNDFRPTIQEEKATYNVTTYKRDIAFRKMILKEYDFTCSICEMKFHIGDLVEAQAAHIVPKRQSGTDDPRNGISLCRTHHWAFDSGIFSLSNDYRVQLSHIAKKANSNKFNLLDFSEKQVTLPQNNLLHPHPVALAWHRQNIWQKQSQQY